MTQEELRQFNQDTRDSIRGENNYTPGRYAGYERHYPKHNPYDIPGDNLFNEIDHPKD